MVSLRVSRGEATAKQERSKREANTKQTAKQIASKTKPRPDPYYSLMSPWFHGFARCRLRTHQPRKPKGIVNTTETGELLRTRRNLTGTTFNDDTIRDWHHAIGAWSFAQCHDALVDASRTERKVTVAHLIDRLPVQRRPGERRHSPSCLCSGRGWILVEQHSAVEMWMAWDHCPEGPNVGFWEGDDNESVPAGTSPAMLAAIDAAHLLASPETAS